MNTENPNTSPVQFAVKTAFVLKTGKRGRPVKGEVNELFNLVSRDEATGNYVLAHSKRPAKSWTFTAQQVAEWFNEAEKE